MTTISHHSTFSFFRWFYNHFSPPFPQHLEGLPQYKTCNNSSINKLNGYPLTSHFTASRWSCGWVASGPKVNKRNYKVRTHVHTTPIFFSLFPRVTQQNRQKTLWEPPSGETGFTVTDAEFYKLFPWINFLPPRAKLFLNTKPFIGIPHILTETCSSLSNSVPPPPKIAQTDF